jgi:hypothetical protein
VERRPSRTRSPAQITRLAGINLGGFRALVAASKPEAILISFGSVKAVPMNVMPDELWAESLWVVKPDDPGVWPEDRSGTGGATPQELRSIQGVLGVLVSRLSRAVLP